MFTSSASNAPWLGYSIPMSGSRHLATACGQQVERKRRIAVVRQPDHPPVGRAVRLHGGVVSPAGAPASVV
jgi:hypothetical protein